MICRECGEKIKPESRFCEKCGAKIANEPAETVDQNTKKKTKKSKLPLIIGIIIAAIVAIVLAVLITVGVIVLVIFSKGKGNGGGENEISQDLDYDLYDYESITDLSPETPEEYDAYFDLMEYYTLGEECENEYSLSDYDIEELLESDTDE